MRLSISSSGLLSAVLLLAACSDEGQYKDKGTTLSDVKQETQQAVNTTAAYAKEERDEFLQQMQRQLNETNAEIAELKQQADRAGSELKASVNQEIQALQEQSRDIQRQLQQAQTAGGEAWATLKDGIARAMEELKKSYRKAEAKFEQTSKQS